MLTPEDSNMAANGICHAAEGAKNTIDLAVSEYLRPCVVYKPKLQIDGNQWCALYGDNLQEGVAGFGDSPANAMFDFDVQWHKRLGS